MKLILGLLKGALIGGALGYGAYAAKLSGSWNWITYGLIGALVGLLAGKPIWRHLADSSSTVFTPILKAIFGFGIAVGIYALVAKVWGGFELSLMDESRNIVNWTFITGGVIGALYGAFVEVDDAPDKAPAKKLDA
jgi:hypothetical protein